MKFFLTCGILALLTSLSINSTAQLYLGSDTEPNPISHIIELPYLGQVGDFSGGYQVGDTVANFTVYNGEGQQISLSDVTQSGKHIIMNSCTATCPRFFNCFDVQNAEAKNQMTRTWFVDHQDDFEWIWIYGPEAHPGDPENCGSNCPAVIIPAPNGDTLMQHISYADRLAARSLWMDIADDQDYPFDFPFDVWVDNPDNPIYLNYFTRPFGTVVLDCNGVVVARGDWTADWFANEGGKNILNGILNQDECLSDIVHCDETSIDNDLDGFCDNYEEWLNSNNEDPCDPDNTDTDNDGICNNQELIDGTDPYNPLDPGEPYDGSGEGLDGEQNNDLTLGLHSERPNKFNIYPMPARNEFTIEGAVAGSQMLVYTKEGRLHSDRVLVTNSTVVDASSWANGVYTIIVVNNDQVRTSRAIIQR